MDRPSQPTPPANEVAERLQGPLEGWLSFLVESGGEIGGLLGAGALEQRAKGYVHTLREIAQQPVTWMETAAAVRARVATFEKERAHLTDDRAPGTVLLTGSGSSLYAAECLSPALQTALALPVRAVPGGEILVSPRATIPPRGPCLLVSFARSGNSPESCGVVDVVLDAAPHCRHLVITCNREGRLATRYGGDSRVAAVVLDDRTCDRSLVMTSSFTNMVLAGRFLAMTSDGIGYATQAAALVRLGAAVLLNHGDALARAARSEYRSAVYLGSGGGYGAAREGALKMLEMTGGRVPAFAETYLGLRHGPMCAVDDGALVVCFLAADPVTRAYEIDLVHELNRKQLGARKVVVGHDVPSELASDHDVIVELSGLAAVGDDGATLIHVLVGQLLAFFRCLSIGLRPDAPSAEGVISRVVETFAIHRRS